MILMVFDLVGHEDFPKQSLFSRKQNSVVCSLYAYMLIKIFRLKVTLLPGTVIKIKWYLYFNFSDEDYMAVLGRKKSATRKQLHIKVGDKMFCRHTCIY